MVGVVVERGVDRKSSRMAVMKRVGKREYHACWKSGLIG